MSFFLLRHLQTAGVVRGYCIGMGDADGARKLPERMPALCVVRMPENTRPGPFWAVKADDARRLIAAGHELYAGELPDDAG